MRADKAQMELQQVRLCGVVRGVGRLRATALGDEWQAGKMRAEGARCSQGAQRCGVRIAFRTRDALSHGSSGMYCTALA